MSEIEPDDLFGSVAHAADQRLLAVRRGQPIKELGALFPHGRLWHTILLVSYLELAVVEASGVAAWQPITGYLWLQLYVGLIPTIWRWMRPATQHQVNAERRAAMESQAREAAEADERSHDDDPADEDGKRDAPPEAWVDELTPEPESKTDIPMTVFRILIMPVLWIAAIIPLQLGLNIAIWARERWQITLPVIAALALAAWFAYQKLRPLLSRALAPAEDPKLQSTSEASPEPPKKPAEAHGAVTEAAPASISPAGFSGPTSAPTAHPERNHTSTRSSRRISGPSQA